MPRSIINSQPAVAGRYKVSWVEEVTRTAIVTLQESDCAGAKTLVSAAIMAVEDGGHPDGMTSEIGDQDDFYVYSE